MEVCSQKFQITEKEDLFNYMVQLGLLDYDKNHNHDYFGQYCNHDYLTRLIAGCITKKNVNANLMYSVNSLL